MLFSRNSCLMAFFSGLFAVIGDFLESKLKTPWSIALADNLTHAVIAFFTWWAVSPHQLTFEIIKCNFLCSFLASLIDIDHFVSSASWRLSDATNLKGRPFLHNTTLLVFVAFSILIIGSFGRFPSLSNLGWIVLAAGLSHHIRDSTRRGFWVWPFKSTPAIPYAAYIALLIILPLILTVLRSSFTNTPKSLKITNHIYVETI